MGITGSGQFQDFGQGMGRVGKGGTVNLVHPVTLGCETGKPESRSHNQDNE